MYILFKRGVFQDTPSVRTWIIEWNIVYRIARVLYSGDRASRYNSNK